MEILFGLAFVAIVLIASVYANDTQNRTRREKLKAYADRLTAGQFTHDHGGLFKFGDALVKGRLDDWEVELFADSASEGLSLTYRVKVPWAAGDFDIKPVGELRRIGRWLGLEDKKHTGNDWVDDKYVFDGSAQELGRLFQSGELERAVDALFMIGFKQVSMTNGTLVITSLMTTPQQLDRRKLESVFLALIRVARLSRRQKFSVKVDSKPTVRFGWTGGTRAVRCPFCRDSIDPNGANLSACQDCKTLHHSACLDEAGGCTIFGCRGRRRQRA